MEQIAQQFCGAGFQFGLCLLGVDAVEKALADIGES